MLRGSLLLRMKRSYLRRTEKAFYRLRTKVMLLPLLKPPNNLKKELKIKLKKMQKDKRRQMRKMLLQVI